MKNRITKMIEEVRQIVESLKRPMILFVQSMDYLKKMFTNLQWMKLKLFIELHIRNLNVIKFPILNWLMCILIVLLIMVKEEQ